MKYIIALLLIPLVMGHPQITAVLYDPQGTDTGNEWIELYNPTNITLNLSTYSLEKGNGANENDWTLLWTGSSFMSNNSYYLIGESRGDEILPLKLQNGPDAIRLLYNEQVIETVGWGEHEFTEYYDFYIDDVTSLPIVRNVNSEGVYLNEFIGKVYTPKNSYFDPLLGDLWTIDISVLLTISNEPPQITGISIQNEDISSKEGIQIINDSILIELDIDDSDIDEIQVFVESDSLDHTFIFNATQQVLLDSLPPGVYSVTVTAIDSSTQKDSLFTQFEIVEFISLEVQSAQIELVQFNKTHLQTNFTVHNLGNVPFDLETQFSLDQVDSFFFEYNGETFTDIIPLNLMSNTNATIELFTTMPPLSPGSYMGNLKLIALP